MGAHIEEVAQILLCPIDLFVVDADGGQEGVEVLPVAGPLLAEVEGAADLGADGVAALALGLQPQPVVPVSARESREKGKKGKRAIPSTGKEGREAGRQGW